MSKRENDIPLSTLNSGLSNLNASNPRLQGLRSSGQSDIVSQSQVETMQEMVDGIDRETAGAILRAVGELPEGSNAGFSMGSGNSLPGHSQAPYLASSERPPLLDEMQLESTDSEDEDSELNPKKEPNPTTIADLRKWPKPFSERLEVYKDIKNKKNKSHQDNNAARAFEELDLKGQATQIKAILTDSNNLLFRGKIRDITLNYGYQAATYFRFVRDLIMHSILAVIFCMSFIILPQMFTQPIEKATCDAAGFISGESCLTSTFMYYGFYGTGWNEGVNETAKWNSGYNLPLAYQLCMIAFYLLWLYLVALDVMESLKRGIQVGLLTGTNIAMKVFCAWDYSIGRRNAKTKKQRQIKIMFEEEAAQAREANQNPENASFDWAAFFISLTTWFIYTCLVAAIAFGLLEGNEFAQDYVNNINVDGEAQKYIGLWVLPVLVTVANYIIPITIRTISYFERKHISKTKSYYFQLVRNLLARLAIVVFLIVSFAKLYDTSKAANSCWQNSVASTIWRIVLADVLINQLLLSIILNGVVRHLLCMCFLDNKVKPQDGETGAGESEEKESAQSKNFRAEFTVVDNVLDLIFIQSLCWLGIFFFPFMSVLVIAQYLLIFYIRSWLLEADYITMETVRYRAVHGKMLISICELVALLLSIVWYGYFTIVSDDTALPIPCGAFESYASYTEPWDLMLSNLQSKNGLAWVGFILALILNPWFIYTINIGLLSGCYVAWQYRNAHKKNVNRLEQQLKDWSKRSYERQSG